MSLSRLVVAQWLQANQHCVTLVTCVVPGPGPPLSLLRRTFKLAHSLSYDREQRYDFTSYRSCLGETTHSHTEN